MNTKPNSTHAEAVAISRRNLVKALGAGMAITGAAAGVVVAANPAKAATAENPALVALGAKLAEAITEYETAKAERKAIETEWGPRWPDSPEELRKPFPDYRRDAIERGLTGWANRLANPDLPEDAPGNYWVALETPKEIQAEIAAWRRSASRSRKPDSISQAETKLAEAYRMETLSNAYEAAKADILKRSGYDAAVKREAHAMAAVHALVEPVMQAEAHGIDGIIIKAGAIVGWGKLPDLVKAKDLLTTDWAGDLAKEIIAFAEAQS